MFVTSFHVKMNKFASFYVIFAFWGIDFEDFCVNLQSQSENKYDGCGDQEVVWRRSAPFALIKSIIIDYGREYEY